MSINNVTLLGRLTKDPELRKTQSGLSVCTFNVAVDRNLSKEKRSDPNTQTADFIRCVAYRNSADFLTTYCHKGDRVSVVGRIQTGSYTDSTGKIVFTQDVVVTELHAETDRKAIGENTQPIQNQGFNNQQQTNMNIQPNTSYNGNHNGNPYNRGNQNGGLDISDDDLPF